MDKTDIITNLNKYKTQARQLSPNAVVVPYTRAIKAVNKMEDITHADLTTRERYLLSCEEYRMDFAGKHGYSVNSSYWIGDIVGGVVDFGFYTADMETIRYDLDFEINEKEFEKWCEYCLACADYGISFPNYRSWCKGCPRLSADDWKKLIELREVLKGQTVKF